MARRTGREADWETGWRRLRAGRRIYGWDTGIPGGDAVRRLSGSGTRSRRTAAAEDHSEGPALSGRKRNRQLVGLGYGRREGRQFGMRLVKAAGGKKTGRAGSVGVAIVVGVEPLMPLPVRGEDAGQEDQSTQQSGHRREDWMPSGLGRFGMQSVCM
jgi:hypothetical protein